MTPHITDDIELQQSAQEDESRTEISKVASLSTRNLIYLSRGKTKMMRKTFSAQLSLSCYQDDLKKWLNQYFQDE